jgi:hypothetical protein
LELWKPCPGGANRIRALHASRTTLCVCDAYGVIKVGSSNHLKVSSPFHFLYPSSSPPKKIELNHKTQSVPSQHPAHYSPKVDCERENKQSKEIPSRRRDN